MATATSETQVTPNLFLWFDQLRRTALLEACQRDDEEVTRAIASFDQGTFGNCASCGEAIDRDYLAVHPWAERCADCQVGSKVIAFRPRMPLASLRARIEEEGGRLLLTAEQMAGRPAEFAPPTFQDELAAGLSDEAQNQLRLIRDALARLDDGTYGTCRACGLPIDQAWLNAEPWIGDCASCAPGPRVIRRRPRQAVREPQPLAA